MRTLDRQTILLHLAFQAAKLLPEIEMFYSLNQLVQWANVNNKNAKVDIFDLRGGRMKNINNNFHELGSATVYFYRIITEKDTVYGKVVQMGE